MDPVNPQESGSGRLSERAGLDISVQVVTENGITSFGRSHDVSCKGMSIYFATELEVGAPIRIKFTLPNSRVALDLKAVIKNRVGFRYGVQFSETTAAELDEIARVTGILLLTQH
jgi:hypothetical protein